MKSYTLEVLKDKISTYRKEKNHRYYLDNIGGISSSINIITYNNSTENDINAQELNLIYKGLIEMYSSELSYDDGRRCYLFLNENKEIDMCYDDKIKIQGTTYSPSFEILNQVINDMGKDLIKFMIENLK